MSNQKLASVFILVRDLGGKEVKVADGTLKLVRASLLFGSPEPKMKYPRKGVKTSDAMISLRTTKLSVARQQREDCWAGLRTKKLGLNGQDRWNDYALGAW